jgi:hypothetical protein
VNVVYNTTKGVVITVASYETQIIGNDCTFELDTFGKPRLCSTTETLKNVVLYILFSKPGQYPSIPHLGMDIRSLLYNYYDDLSETELEDRLVQQCSALYPYVQTGNIRVRKMIYRNMPSIIVYVSTDENDSVVNGQVSRNRKNNSLEFYIGLSVDDLGNLLYNINKRYAENY